MRATWLTLGSTPTFVAIRRATWTAEAAFSAGGFPVTGLSAHLCERDRRLKVEDGATVSADRVAALPSGTTIATGCSLTREDDT